MVGRLDHDFSVCDRNGGGGVRAGELPGAVFWICEFEPEYCDGHGDDASGGGVDQSLWDTAGEFGERLFGGGGNSGDGGHRIFAVRDCDGAEGAPDWIFV